MIHIQRSLKRGALRIVLLAISAAMLLVASHAIPMLLGPVLAPLAFGFGLCFMGLAAGDFALRILQPMVDAQQAANDALHNNVGAGLVYLGRCILAATVLMLIVTAPRASELPANAIKNLPILKEEQRLWWPDHPLPSALGAQVEQESCVSLKNPRCWASTAELRTARERGVGLGQITKTARFDALAEMRVQFPKALAGWSWDNASLYDPHLQLRALILMDYRNYRTLTDVTDSHERLAMSLAAYNGGQGGLASDRRACAGTPGCDPKRWWGNVEHTSLKAKTAVAGYGKSFFEVNREYPKNIIFVRRGRYLELDA